MLVVCDQVLSVSGTWTVDALSRETQMTQSLLGKRLAFWVSHGILHECAKDTFTVVEEQRCDMIHLGKVERNSEIWRHTYGFG